MPGLFRRAPLADVTVLTAMLVPNPDSRASAAQALEVFNAAHGGSSVSSNSSTSRRSGDSSASTCDERSVKLTSPVPFVSTLSSTTSALATTNTTDTTNMEVYVVNNQEEVEADKEKSTDDDYSCSGDTRRRITSISPAPRPIDGISSTNSTSEDKTSNSDNVGLDMYESLWNDGDSTLRSICESVQNVSDAEVEAHVLKGPGASLKFSLRTSSQCLFMILRSFIHI